MSLRDDIERETRMPVRLRLGAPGALDVFFDGKRIYSKKKSGCTPTSRELIDLIRTKAAGR